MATMTGCTAPRLGDHDYSQPPHNTPETPRDATAGEGCGLALAAPTFAACNDEPACVVVLYSPGTHEWVKALACTPCIARIRRDGPAIAQVSNIRQPEGSRQ